MPVYEYQCKACGVRFERVQRFTDEPVKVCPECGGSVYRLVQPVGIIFKGSGFYVTDHRAASSTTGAGKKSSKEAGDSGTNEKE
ncbi:MAG: FmdB family zinc ribbon protein [Anaerolineae bacterium]|nr:zinc ribbon domain-containing protein [Anaerolineae bacterium]MDW8068219.1 FmdB family zinc ribbon protein [Anaerolineae bacterium]